MTTVQTFDSFEDMQAVLLKAETEAQEAARHHHIKPEDLAPGDYFVSARPELGLIIFGQVIEVTMEMCDFDPENEEDREAYKEEEADRKASHKMGYIFGRCYGLMCPEGELGSTHITHIDAKIPEVVFKRAQILGWVPPPAGQG